MGVFFLRCVGKQSSHAVRKGKEGRTKGGSRGGFEGVAAQRLLYLLRSLPSLPRPASKPPNPAIRQISLCHPRNAGDNYRLSVIQGLSPLPVTMLTPPCTSRPQRVRLKRREHKKKRQGRGCAGGLELKLRF